MSIPVMSTCSLCLTHTGVKNADENELRSIASDPEEIHMYNVADFSFLLDIVDDLTNNLCNSVKGPGTGPPCGHCTYVPLHFHFIHLQTFEDQNCIVLTVLLWSELRNGLY